MSETYWSTEVGVALLSCLSTSFGEATAEETKARRVTVLYCILMELRNKIKRMSRLARDRGGLNSRRVTRRRRGAEGEFM